MYRKSSLFFRFFRQTRVSINSNRFRSRPANAHFGTAPASASGRSLGVPRDFTRPSTTFSEHKRIAHDTPESGRDAPTARTRAARTGPAAGPTLYLRRRRVFISRTAAATGRETVRESGPYDIRPRDVDV